MGVHMKTSLKVETKGNIINERLINDTAYNGILQIMLFKSFHDMKKSSKLNLQFGSSILNQTYIINPILMENIGL